jgi:hypothetical protein
MVAAPLAAVLSAAPEFAADSQPTVAAGSTAAVGPTAAVATGKQYGISK